MQQDHLQVLERPQACEEFLFVGYNQCETGLLKHTPADQVQSPLPLYPCLLATCLTLGYRSYMAP